MRFSEEEKKEKLTVTTPGGLEISMGDEKKTIEIRDKDKKNSVTINGQSGEIRLNADKKMVLSIGGTEEIIIEKSKVEIKSGTVQVTGNQSLKMKGQSASLTGSQVQIKADAGLTAEASGITQVKGTMVKIN